jgi:hypothetical protein
MIEYAGLDDSAVQLASGVYSIALDGAAGSRSRKLALVR